MPRQFEGGIIKPLLDTRSITGDWQPELRESEPCHTVSTGAWLGPPQKRDPYGEGVGRCLCGPPMPALPSPGAPLQASGTCAVTRPFPPGPHMRCHSWCPAPTCCLSQAPVLSLSGCPGHQAGLGLLLFLAHGLDTASRAGVAGPGKPPPGTPETLAGYRDLRAPWDTWRAAT